jgi:hypothetical protein
MALQHLRSSTADKRPTPGAMSDGQLAMNTNLASPGLFFKDSNGDLVKTGPVHVGTTAPNATPASGGQAGNSKGELWLDTSGTDYTLKTWDGSAWREIVVTSAMIKNGTVVNADISASAAIGLSKLATGALPSGITVASSNIVNGTIVNADINNSAAIALSKLATGALPTAITVASANIVDGTIVNADVNASAAIAGTKISPDFGSQNVVTTGDVQSASINGGPLAGMRNAIINGNFDIWQRGTSSSSSGFFSADRWGSVIVGTTHSVSRQAFTLGQTDVPGEPTFYHRTVVSSVAGAGNFAILIQRIEDVRTFAGQQVTVSFWAKADATKNIAVDLQQLFGTGGSPSAEVTAIGVTKVSIGTSWQKVTITATVPSISGKTLGTNNDSALSIFIWFDAGSDSNSRTDTLGQQSGTFDIAQVQVEPGPVATPFERRPIGTELALCQRYYEQASVTEFYQGYVSPTATVGIGTRFVVTKRATPTVTLGDGSAGLELVDTAKFRSFLNGVGANAWYSHSFTADAEL